MAGDDGPKLLNAFDNKHRLGHNCITAIIESIKHSIVSSVPKKKKEEEEDEDDQNQGGLFFTGFGNQNNEESGSNVSGFEFNAHGQV